MTEKSPSPYFTAENFFAQIAKIAKENSLSSDSSIEMCAKVVRAAILQPQKSFLDAIIAHDISKEGKPLSGASLEDIRRELELEVTLTYEGVAQHYAKELQAALKQPDADIAAVLTSNLNMRKPPSPNTSRATPPSDSQRGQPLNGPALAGV